MALAIIIWAAMQVFFFFAKACKTTQGALWRSPYTTELSDYQQTRAPIVGRRGGFCSVFKQKIHDTKTTDARHWVTIAAAARAAKRSNCFSRRQELIQLPLLNNAKVKRKGDYGVASWEQRHDGATLFSTFPEKSIRSSSTIFPKRERTAVLPNHILCLLQTSESKMSNVSHHNSLPLHIH